MAATSEMGKLSEAIAAAIDAQYAWDTTPAAAWYPDFDRDDLQAGGLTCLALPMGRVPELVARGHTAQRYEVHVTIYQPIGSGAAFADGDAVVKRAEDLAGWILGNSQTINGQVLRCVESEPEPIISKDAARQYRLWLSYVKTFWR